MPVNLGCGSKLAMSNGIGHRTCMFDGAISGSPGNIGGISTRWIAAGDFMMGSPSDEVGRYEYEKLHRVTLTNGFWIFDHPVTQGEFEAIDGFHPLLDPREPSLAMDDTSWEDCDRYCELLTKIHLEQNQIPHGWAWRLPTEAEWEYAARAGHSGPIYGPLDDIAWHRGNSGSQIQPVKQKLPNAWGLFDVIGNVWEWCADSFDEYPDGPVTDPVGPTRRALRVLRGGSADAAPRRCRLANRHRFYTGIPEIFFGFRPVLSMHRSSVAS